MTFPPLPLKTDQVTGIKEFNSVTDPTPFVCHVNFHPSAEFIERVPISFARRHKLLGLAGDSHSMRVAVPAKGAFSSLDLLSRFLERPLIPVFVADSDILKAINQAYQQRTGNADIVVEKLRKEDVAEDIQRLTESQEDLLDTSDRAPIIKLVNAILFEAVRQRASDVHVQPYEERIIVRFRIDGILFDFFDLPKRIQGEVASRIKVMGRMNIAERRVAQDGRATAQVGDRLVDLRISSVPTNHGERLVIRLLDKSAMLYTLEELGMPDQQLRRFRKLISSEHGILLVTGPTGGGKSTTLYAALMELNAKELNVITLEDPIEYQLPGISQIQISDKKGMTFASGLRSVLRQDPDIIMVGEIRDQETAVMAIQSSLTGHLVFSTLHTNDAASAITRLLDLGIEPYLIASSLLGVVAQRLVRMICKSCHTQYNANEAEMSAFDTPVPLTLFRGKGCTACRNTGYNGRLGIFEVLSLDASISEKILPGVTAATIRHTGIANGMTSLRSDALTKVRTGYTTLEEAQRVTMKSLE